MLHYDYSQLSGIYLLKMSLAANIDNSRLFISGNGGTFTEFNDELPIRLSPVPIWHDPFIGDVTCGQIERLSEGIIIRKDRLVLCHFPELPVEPLQSIGRAMPTSA